MLMKIDRGTEYHVGDYSYKNYIQLTDAEIRLVWKWRNDSEIRKWMSNPDIIPYEKHIAYVESLKGRNDVYYWLVFKKNVPIGSFNLTKIDRENNKAEAGYYLAPELLNSGEGFGLHNNYKQFVYNYLEVEMLTGYVLFGNTRTMQMSLFFGAEMQDIICMDNKQYVRLLAPRDKFNSVEQKGVLHQFVKYCKYNTIDWDKILEEHARV